LVTINKCWSRELFTLITLAFKREYFSVTASWLHTFGLGFIQLLTLRANFAYSVLLKDSVLTWSFDACSLRLTRCADNEIVWALLACSILLADRSWSTVTFLAISLVFSYFEEGWAFNTFPISSDSFSGFAFSWLALVSFFIIVVPVIAYTA
jgi:hypothetical protein